MAEMASEDPRAEQLGEEDAAVIAHVKATQDAVHLICGMDGYEIPLSRFKSEKEAGYTWNQRIPQIKKWHPTSLFGFEEYPATDPNKETKFLVVIL